MSDERNIYVQLELDPETHGELTEWAKEDKRSLRAQSAMLLTNLVRERKERRQQSRKRPLQTA